MVSFLTAINTGFIFLEHADDEDWSIMVTVPQHLRNI